MQKPENPCWSFFTVKCSKLSYHFPVLEALCAKHPSGMWKAPECQMHAADTVCCSFSFALHFHSPLLLAPLPVFISDTAMMEQ